MEIVDRWKTLKFSETNHLKFIVPIFWLWYCHGALRMSSSL